MEPPAAVASSDLQYRHRQAIGWVRAGDFDAALALLHDLVRDSPDTPRYQYDLIAVLCWRGRHHDCVQRFERAGFEQTPDYVKMAVAGSARRTDRAALALRLYDSVLQHDPDNVEAVIGRALATAEEGSADRAMIDLSRFEQSRYAESAVEYADREPDARARFDAATLNRLDLTRAHIDTERRAFLRAVGWYARILRRTPDHPVARSAMATSLARAGAPHQAYRWLAPSAPAPAGEAASSSPWVAPSDEA
ncbi:MAG: hypothetical protein KDK91_23955, partial [Gammaproteobacteria bacterium]|nr:hypothetical protein [Gammaproteobacteria bacterium]